MQKIFTRYLFGVITVAFCAMMLAGWVVQSKNAQIHMIDNSRLKLMQVSQTLKANDAELDMLMDSLKEDYLTRAHAFAYIIEQNPEALNSPEELERIKVLLNVDELHVIDENGFLFAGTVPKYFGMDFRSTDQTAEFLQILDDPEFCLVQDIRPNGAEQKLFQYVGVARQDQKGIVQVGLAPVRFLEAQKKNELSYLFSIVPVDAGSTIFVVDADTGEFLAHSSPQFQGKNVEEVGFSLEDLDNFSSGGFHKYEGRRRFYVIEREGNRYLGISQKEKELYKERGEQMRILCICFLLISCIMMVAINHLVKIKIVNGIHRIMEKLSDITDGNLDTVVEVEDNPEFRQLSAKINQMVSSILEATVKVSRVIDMVDMPIGVFEIGAESGEVKATDRLARILGWSRMEQEENCRDREHFMAALERVKLACEREAEDIYLISGEPECWVRIQIISDDSGIFGVVNDVTQDIMDKRRIKHERDYDSLTGLRNIAKFRRKVSNILETGETLGCCAMMMMDLDHFKSINDKYGHDWGDTYLQFTAELLRRFEGEDGITARRSGDEFCVFVHHFVSRKLIVDRLNDFYRELESSLLLFPDGERRTISISVGLAWYGEELTDYETLMKAADEALYEAKAMGRNTYRCYEKVETIRPNG